MSKENYLYWNFLNLQNIKINNELISKIQNIYLDGFQTDVVWNEKSIRNRLNNSSFLGFLIGDNNKTFGYIIYTIPKLPFQKKYLLWTGSICIRKEMQGKGFSKQVVNDFFQYINNKKIYQDYKFGYFAERTQNPIVLKKYIRMKNIYPFTNTYENNKGKELLKYIVNNIEEISRVKNLSMKYGICYGAYTSNKLKKYAIKEINEFENKLKEFGFNRNNGDSIIIVGELD